MNVFLSSLCNLSSSSLFFSLYIRLVNYLFTITTTHTSHNLRDLYILLFFSSSLQFCSLSFSLLEKLRDQLRRVVFVTTFKEKYDNYKYVRPWFLEIITRRFTFLQACMWQITTSPSLHTCSNLKQYSFLNKQKINKTHQIWAHFLSPYSRYHRLKFNRKARP